MSAAPVLFDAEGLLVIDKPPGIAVIPGREEEAGASLRARLEASLGRPLWVVHRLDRDTTGVLVFATDAATHRRLSMAFEHGEVRKRYLALVEGRLERPLTIELPLVPARRGRMRPAGAGEEGKAATTKIAPVEAHALGSLVSAEPLTGRTHQIRVHLRSAGHPLLFDHQYGRKTPLTLHALGGEGDAVVLDRTPLHASELELPGQPSRTFRAPLPADMTRALSVLRGT